MTPIETESLVAPSKTPQTSFGPGFVLDAWYFVALSRDIAAASLKRHELLGEPVLIGRTRAGQVYALRDICPHRAAPLSAGRLVENPGEGETIECCYHGWRFRPDGVCAAIPSLVEDQTCEVDRIRVRSYPLRESQGMVFVWMASDPRTAPDPDHEPPILPGIAGAEAKRVDGLDFDAHVDHAVSGLMGPAHGPGLHPPGWGWSGRSVDETAEAFEPREHGFAMVRHAVPSNRLAGRILGGLPETEITFRLPGYRWDHIRVGNKQVLALTCLTPRTETRTTITRIIWSDHWIFPIGRPLPRRSLVTGLKPDGGPANLQKDGSRSGPAPIPSDDADQPTDWYPLLKREWTMSRAEGRPFANPVKAGTLRSNP